MLADDLATQVAKVSAAVALTFLSQNILVSATERLIWFLGVLEGFIWFIDLTANMINITVSCIECSH